MSREALLATPMQWGDTALANFFQTHAFASGSDPVGATASGMTQAPGSIYPTTPLGTVGQMLTARSAINTPIVNKALANGACCCGGEDVGRFAIGPGGGTPNYGGGDPFASSQSPYIQLPNGQFVANPNYEMDSGDPTANADPGSPSSMPSMLLALRGGDTTYGPTFNFNDPYSVDNNYSNMLGGGYAPGLPYPPPAPQPQATTMPTATAASSPIPGVDTLSSILSGEAKTHLAVIIFGGLAALILLTIGLLTITRGASQSPIVIDAIRGGVSG